jgi:hypothetical protein
VSDLQYGLLKDHHLLNHYVAVWHITKKSGQHWSLELIDLFTRRPPHDIFWQPWNKADTLEMWPW